MSLPVKFDHCVVHVTDWERSNQFYREVVGAEIIDRNGRFVYRFGETQLNLHGPGVKAGPPRRGAGTSRRHRPLLCLERSDRRRDPAPASQERAD